MGSNPIRSIGGDTYGEEIPMPETAVSDDAFHEIVVQMHRRATRERNSDS